MPFHHLPHEDITALHDAAMDTGLTASRTSLLGGLDASFKAGLPTHPSPAAQLLSDLHALNDTEALADGTVPLRTWLTNARALTSSRRESAVFQYALDQIAPPSPGGGGGEPAPAQPRERRGGAKLTGAEIKELMHALLSAFPSRDTLALMLRVELDRALDEIAGAGNLRDTVFALITAAEAQGWVPRLLEGAVAHVPGNDALRAIADKHRP
jgi:Effector-associated domain 5/Effector-associated domain 1